MEPTMDTVTQTAAAMPDLAAMKQQQLKAWSSGDYAVVGTTLQIVGEALCEAVDVRACDNVIDVAAGNGNAALAAARRYADVTATDYVPELLEHAQRRAQAEGLPLLTRVADAEDLPFPDGSFDVALSTFGVMFAPNQERAAVELMRVVRPDGRIGLASWTPDGFVGQLFREVGRFSPPPAGVMPPTAWGSETRIVELFGPFAVDIRTERRQYVFRLLSAEHWIEVFRRDYGPIHRAFESLEAPRQTALHAALSRLLARNNRGGRESLVVPSEYLETVIRLA
jgi:ubiquinone/menaquinone biosynthesis C-methylase UbiE